jgi:hypothetical protein
MIKGAIAGGAVGIVIMVLTFRNGEELDDR